MGAYHGHYGFETFSHTRAVYERSTFIDPPMIYPPYTAKKMRLIRRALGLGDPRELLARLKQRVLRRR
jgi:aldehyde dehydrogenase (NAD+)